ncbi:MAG: GTP-binding protein [Candidatus Magasanikbacteria bacterium CG10_big_fil_rev_8_21_14_0_10_38_6]|uniref:GTP-binding protein n=1 Tax=Candidatus Magasanikbacteria bacterium CG10_big_fil_rev_8_21_14_0_10_38_6 TaxID=1974647 RepID=A0A2M6P1K3_9BACT|nr:MAG: GTP-binding protein [Candidatus Magasanikbacteria bacterium CG10_big_fil_rev_8_21_14_0_10_38_6]
MVFRDLFLLVVSAACCSAVLFFQWSETVQLYDELYVTSYVLSDGVTVSSKITATRKDAPLFVKGLYLTAYSAASSKKRAEIISLIDKTELNAVVIDIKDYSGYVLYDSQVSIAKEFGLVDDRLGGVAALVQEFHDHNIYVIARQTVFQDPVLAEKKYEWAITRRGGGVWRDYKGLAWVDPTRKEIWEYNAAIAKEVSTFGFDEINFDYVRYPSDGPIQQAVYSHSEREKTENMGMFFSYLNTQLAVIPVYISLDFFGFVMERHDGISIGQRLEDAVGEVDYISPMMYPSHYPSGHLGFSNPAAHPYAVLDNGMKKGAPYFVDTRARVRPWIQAFNIGAQYGAANIRAQIDAIEQYPNAGWLLWNAANRYSTAGLTLVTE